MFISGWNAVTHRSVQTKWGRGGSEVAASIAQFSLSAWDSQGAKVRSGGAQVVQVGTEHRVS